VRIFILARSHAAENPIECMLNQARNQGGRREGEAPL